MFTVNEVSKELSVSKVTIYSKLKKHRDLVVIKQGQKYITEDLFNLIKNELNVKTIKNDELNMMNLDSDLNQVNSGKTEHLTSQNNILIDNLLKQLEIKDKQIFELQDIIKTNNKLMENNQVLLKNSHQQDPVLLQQHFEELDKKINDMTEKMTERNLNSKKSIWNRLRGK